jgi:hypothetical protein
MTTTLINPNRTNIARQTFTIEKPATDWGMILEDVTKADLIREIHKQNPHILLDENEIIFLSHVSAKYYDYDEPPIELGLWLCRVVGVLDDVKYWIVSDIDRLED